MTALLQAPEHFGINLNLAGLDPDVMLDVATAAMHMRPVDEDEIPRSVNIGGSRAALEVAPAIARLGLVPIFDSRLSSLSDGNVTPAELAAANVEVAIISSRTLGSASHYEGRTNTTPAPSIRGLAELGVAAAVALETPSGEAYLSKGVLTSLIRRIMSASPGTPSRIVVPGNWPGLVTDITECVDYILTQQHTPDAPRPALYLEDPQSVTGKTGGSAVRSMVERSGDVDPTQTGAIIADLLTKIHQATRLAHGEAA